MSANFLEGIEPKLSSGTTYADGAWSIPANSTGKDANALDFMLAGLSALAGNQTCHVGASLRAAKGAAVYLWAGVAYKDAAGHNNYVGCALTATGTGGWQRVEGSIVVPSGMTIESFFVHQIRGRPEVELASPTLSYGSSGPILASDSHTPYATQDHLRSEYATKAALKVTSDAVTAEVTERGKLAGRVGTLESTSGTHTSRLEQLASSIKSLVKGESTYTDPDGKSATSGIYSLVTQTRDSVTALFGDYTKTEDLASTEAVKDAKKAGTDAQAAASAALTDAKAYTDSVEVGGRNLLKGSMSVATAPRTHGWYSNGSSPTVELVTLDGKECIHFSGSPSGAAIPSIRTRSRVLLEWDSVYVMTCDMMFDKEILIGTNVPQHYQFGSVENTDEFNLSVLKKGGGVVDVSYSPKAHEVIAANTWTRYTRVFKTNKTAPSDDYPYPTIAPFIYGNNVRTVSETTEVNGWMRNFKIEKGTKATDWTPAPEDTDFAVADAKKAGTDAQAAASAAQSTADSLATLIRADSTGVTVGKSADGKTYATGRTRMTADGFQVLDKAGNVLSSFGKNLIELGKNSMDATISMLAGLVKIQARNDGSNTVASVSSDFLSFDSLWQATMRAGKETGGAYVGYVEGYAAASAEVTGRSGSARLYCTQGNGSRVTANNAFTVLPDGYDLGRPEYLAAALLGTGGGGGTGITHSQEGVTMTPDLNTCGPGVWSYNDSTANRPTDYGTCVCIRAGDSTSTWLFEFALPTVGDPLWRRNINGAGWTSWWTITSQ